MIFDKSFLVEKPIKFETKVTSYAKHPSLFVHNSDVVAKSEREDHNLFTCIS